MVKLGRLLIILGVFGFIAVTALESAYDKHGTQGVVLVAGVSVGVLIIFITVDTILDVVSAAIHRNR